MPPVEPSAPGYLFNREIRSPVPQQSDNTGAGETCRKSFMAIGQQDVNVIFRLCRGPLVGLVSDGLCTLHTVGTVAATHSPPERRQCVE